MENFSLLSISGPRISSSALSAFPDIMSSHATSLPDCLLGDPQTREPRRGCTGSRPWFSPYSYFVCTDQESHLEAYSFPEVQRDKGRGDGCLPEDPAESICSSSSSQEDAWPREAAKKSGHGLASTDGVTSQDILKAARWHPAHASYTGAIGRREATKGLHREHGYKQGYKEYHFHRNIQSILCREILCWLCNCDSPEVGWHPG
uniref:Spermatosis associated 46 n=1 Tax=Panthera tigris altaica TaxID=74533 RepID=A0A8C9JFG2_PANTA